jgi:hypothetical protein
MALSREEIKTIAKTVVDKIEELTLSCACSIKEEKEA